MLFWIVVVVFTLPLYLLVHQMKSGEKARNQRLSQIQSRLQEKKLDEIEQKKQRINRKFD